MQMRFSVLATIALVVGALASSSARAQVLVETTILTPKKPKDVGAIWDKARKDKPAAKPATKGKSKTASAGAVAAPAKPRALPETFSGETEDPMSILDINPDVIARFASAIAAEVSRRNEDAKLTRAQYDEIGANAGGFTPREYFVLKARIRPFCEAIVAGQAPSDDLTLSYMPSEAITIRPRCSTLLPTLKLTPPIPLGRSGP